VPAGAAGDVTGGLVPYLNGPALTGYYLGVFSLIPLMGLPLGIVAVLCGVAGLRRFRRSPLVRGQVHGGLAQGVAQALYEGVEFDEWGTPLTASLIGYGIPAATELPRFETANTETPTPVNPLGAKGIGEAATIGSTPAVWNAVVDALAHLGVRHLDLPLTPERVWRAIREAADFA
jgi:hypothetical protein